MLETVWKGHLPLKIRLHNSHSAPQPPSSDAAQRLESPVSTFSSSSNGNPPASIEPYFLMVSRCSYLPLHVSTMRKHFSDRGLDFRNGSDLEVWYSFNDIPLRWHYPIGLLHDIHAYGSDLPWCIDVHFGGFPNDVILEMTSHDSLQHQIMHAMKQADYIWNGSGRALMTLTKQEHSQFWHGVWTENFEKYQAVVSKLRPASDQPRNIPLRFYCGGDLQMMQDLVAPVDAHGGMTSVYQCFETMRVGRELPAAESETVFICHGVAVNPETPVWWLALNMEYSDLFVHIVVK